MTKLRKLLLVLAAVAVVCLQPQVSAASGFCDSCAVTEDCYDCCRCNGWGDIICYRMC
jgi:hypothetical protein